MPRAARSGVIDMPRLARTRRVPSVKRTARVRFSMRDVEPSARRLACIRIASTANVARPTESETTNSAAVTRLIPITSP